MRRSARSTCVIALVAVALVMSSACGLSITGGASSTISPDANSDVVVTDNHVDGADVGVVDGDATSSFLDARDDGVVDTPDSSSCIPIVNGAGSLVAPQLKSAPTIDGQLGDWTTCFVHLDQTNAATILDQNPPAAGLAMDLSVAHFGETLYIGAHVTGVGSLGNHSVPDLNKNDSVELYIDADGVTQQAYTSDTLQIIIDHNGNVATFRYPDSVSVSNITSSVVQNGEQYNIEVALVPSTFGLSLFGITVGFDFAINDGNGLDEVSELVWYQKCTKATSCGCPGGSGDAPWCDARQFGSVLLGP